MIWLSFYHGCVTWFSSRKILPRSCITSFGLEIGYLENFLSPSFRWSDLNLQPASEKALYVKMFNISNFLSLLFQSLYL